MTAEEKIETVTEEVRLFILPFSAYFEPGAGLDVLRKITTDLAEIAYNSGPNPLLDPREAGRGLVEAANADDRLACDELIRWAKALHQRGAALPPELADYIDKGPLSVEGWHRPKKPRSNAMPRNTVLLHAIRLAVDRLDCKATRNRATDRVCGCSVVAEACKRLGLGAITERTLEAVWNDRPIHHRQYVHLSRARTV